jgi:hypothetical protein
VGLVRLAAHHNNFAFSVDLDLLDLDARSDHSLNRSGDILLLKSGRAARHHGTPKGCSGLFEPKPPTCKLAVSTQFIPPGIRPEMRPSFFNVEFEWPVASRGYRLVKTEVADSVEPPELFYVVTPIEGPALKRRALDEFPGLFKEFASIEPSPEGVLAFASKFGLLQEDRENELIWWLQYRRDFAELIALKGRGSIQGSMAEESWLRSRSFTETLLELKQSEG